jgi:hypothetical protein
MRRGFTLATLAVIFLVPSAAFAQLSRERVKISNVRLGFPYGGVGGMRGGLFKAGQWTPVYVDLECVRDTDPEENLLLIVETQDADEAITEGVVEFPAMKENDRIRGNELGRIPYLKPGSWYASTVAVRVKGAKSGRTYGEIKDRTFSGVESPLFVVLGIGTNLSGLRFPEVAKARDGNQAEGSRGGWVQSAKIMDAGEMPDQWFGYGAIDLIVAGTGERDFWLALAQPQHEKRRKALAEWVRRGGRLVVSVGANADVLEALKELKDILPATVPPGGKRMETALTFHWKVAGVSSQGNERFDPFGGEFAVNKLEPRADRASKVIVTEDQAGTKPLAVQGSYGLGRVTVFAFDLDRPPVTEWGKRAQFWDNLVNQCGYILPPLGQFEKGYSSIRYDEFSNSLQGSLDYFEGVPVVSFGWVALFILIYIILIGPVDYLFLKKVIRRLEWTWVTFPVIVITVSAGAYFAAYSLKGKDLKINKVDVVDIDLAGKRMDGNTWFTLFSPRIQNYTIGVEPAGGVNAGDSNLPKWVPAEASDAARETIVSWHAHVDQNRLGTTGGTFFSKRYRYQSGIDPVDPNHDLYASGLEGVPIQVWTTKAFHAEWTAPIDPAQPPIIADLRVSPTEDNILTGSITNNLPVEEFTEIALIWRGKVVYVPSDLPIGVPKAVGESSQTGSGGQSLKDWITQKSNWTPRSQTSYTTSGYREPGTTSNPKFALWPVLFSDVAAETLRAQAPNASLRRLDQSWRVSSDRPEQAMLVLRIPTREGPAEQMTRAASSPSRLWLGELPTSGKRRPDVNGTLKQETYVRVLIPVKVKK